MFEKISFNKNGTEVKRLANRKVGLLKVRIQQLNDANVDISRSSLLSSNQKDNNTLENNKRIEIMQDSIELCQVLIDNIDDLESVILTIPEMNFLTNEFVISYK